MNGPSIDPIAVADRIHGLEERLADLSGGRTRLLPVTKAFGPEAVAAVLAAVVLLARQDDNAPVRIIAPTSQQEGPAQVRVGVQRRLGQVDDRPEVCRAMATVGGEGPHGVLLGPADIAGHQRQEVHGEAAGHWWRTSL